MGRRNREPSGRRGRADSQRLLKSPRRHRQFAVVVVPLSLLLIGLAFWLARDLTAPASLPPAAVLVSQDGRLRIPLLQLADGRPHYFQCELSGGRQMRFFALRAYDGTYRTALDACKGCEDGRYYPQGRQMACTVCGKQFGFDELSDKGDNPCLPIAIPHDVEGDGLMIPLAGAEKTAGKLKP